MRKSARVKLELKNSRYADRDLKEQLTELVLYSKYAGISLEHFHKAIAKATVAQGAEGPELGYGGRLFLETDYKTATLISQLVEMYPVFSSWDIKFSEVRRSKPRRQANNNQKEKKMAVKKAKKKKAATKKRPAAKKKKAATKKKPAAKKKKPAAKKKKAAAKRKKR